MARALSRFSPDSLSYLALVLAGLSGLCLYLSFDHWEYLLPLGAVLVLVSGIFDALDGKVARIVGSDSRRGDFLDHVLDRYADVLMIGGVAISGWCHPVLGILAITGVLLTSYMGTQAQAVGAGRMYSGLLGRADRVVLLFLFPLFQWGGMLLGTGSIDLGVVKLSVLELVMVWFALVGNLTAVQRAVRIWRELD
ncbi:MAG: CDP-alcohol phosphatidyltransferase family protein [Methanomassiliicoccales archaeon]